MSHPLTQYLQTVLGLQQILRPAESMGAESVPSPVRVPRFVWLVEGEILSQEQSDLLSKMARAIQVPEDVIQLSTAQLIPQATQDLLDAGVHEIVVVRAQGEMQEAAKLQESVLAQISDLQSVIGNPDHKRQVWNHLKSVMALRRG